MASPSPESECDALAVRLDLDDECEEIVLALCQRFFSDYMYCQEYASKTHKSHWHIYGELRPEEKRQNVRNFINTKLHLFKSRYSMKSADYRETKYIAYILKDGNYAITYGLMDLLEEAQAYDEIIKRELEERNFSKKPVVLQIIQRYEEWHPQDFVEDASGAMAAPWTPHIIQTVIRYYREGNRVASISQMTNMVRMINMKMSQTYCNQLADFLVKEVSLFDRN